MCMCYNYNNRQGEDKMRVSSNPLHNSHYPGGPSAIGTFFLIVCWPFWVFPILMFISFITK
jgi:hypothetical protein